MLVLIGDLQANQTHIIKRLLELKASVDKATRYDETPLDICMLFKSVDALQFLLNARADPDRLTRYGLTPTVQSMTNGDREIISLLVTAWRPSDRDKARIANLARQPYSAKELALAEMAEYTEAFYKEHDRMWGVLRC